MVLENSGRAALQTSESVGLFTRAGPWRGFDELGTWACPVINIFAWSWYGVERFNSIGIDSLLG
jgi:hypothetical protein